MTHASLFSGIGGFDLAAEWAGWTNVFNCEIDPFCRRVLAYHFPKAIQYEDIKTTDFTRHRGTIDVLTGGFPCQPFSLAGKRRGSEDDRYLWSEMLRAIREIQPRWVVGENVYGIIIWSAGMVFEQVQADLENAGYEVQPYIIPACAVDAPHRRDRVWFVARRNVANTQSARFEARFKGSREVQFRRRNSGNIRGWFFDGFPTQSPVCCRNDGLSARLDGVTFPAWRRESIKAYGNAVVPQVVLQIFKAINEYEND